MPGVDFVEMVPFSKQTKDKNHLSNESIDKSEALNLSYFDK